MSEQRLDARQGIITDHAQERASALATPRRSQQQGEMRRHGPARRRGSHSPPLHGVGRSATSNASVPWWRLEHHDCSLAVPRPIKGRVHRAAPKGSALSRCERAPLLTQAPPLPYPGPAAAATCLLWCGAGWLPDSGAEPPCPAHHHAPAPEPPWLETNGNTKAHGGKTGRQYRSTVVQ